MPIGNPIGLAQAARGKTEAANPPAPKTPPAARNLRLDPECILILLEIEPFFPVIQKAANDPLLPCSCLSALALAFLSVILREAEDQLLRLFVRSCTCICFSVCHP